MQYSHSTPFLKNHQISLHFVLVSIECLKYNHYFIQYSKNHQISLHFVLVSIDYSTPSLKSHQIDPELLFIPIKYIIQYLDSSVSVRSDERYLELGLISTKERQLNYGPVNLTDQHQLQLSITT